MLQSLFRYLMGRIYLRRRPCSPGHQPRHKTWFYAVHLKTTKLDISLLVSRIVINFRTTCYKNKEILLDLYLTPSPTSLDSFLLDSIIWTKWELYTSIISSN